MPLTRLTLALTAHAKPPRLAASALERAKRVLDMPLTHLLPIQSSLTWHFGHTPSERLAASPALDLVVLAYCPPADQRGVPRPLGAACDLGAFERWGSRSCR